MDVGTLELVELDESILQGEPRCEVRGCPGETAQWSAWCRYCHGVEILLGATCKARLESFAGPYYCQDCREESYDWGSIVDLRAL